MTRWTATLLLVACSPAARVAPEQDDVAAEVSVASDAAAADTAKPVDAVKSADTSILCDLDCDDGKPCTLDVCYFKIGCTHVPRSGTCNDGNPCTTGDFCVDDTCAGTAMNCDDGNACTDDACALPGACTYTSHC